MSDRDCPTSDELLAYALGKLPVNAVETLADHIEVCSRCQAQLATLDDAQDALTTRLSILTDDPYCREPECQAAIENTTAAVEQLLSRHRDGASDVTVTQQPLPAKLGEYRLLGKLGEGGMGTVYKALHTKLERFVAIKFLPKGWAADERAVSRFEREMVAVGRLSHPNIVQAHDAREVDGERFLVMEFVEGVDFSELVRRCGPLSVADACELVRQVALGLEHVHSHGLVHRDIKPSNLMITKGGRAKILDLGLALLKLDQSFDREMTAAGQAMGTADYMAPEQASDSHQVDIHADIYSLGCTLHYMLTGQPPFAGPKYRSRFDKMMAHVRDPVPSVQHSRPDVPDAVVAVLERLLAKDPSSRFDTPVEVAEAVREFCLGCDLTALLVAAGLDPHKDSAEERLASVTKDDCSSALVSTRPSDRSDSWGHEVVSARVRVGNLGCAFVVAAACLLIAALPIVLIRSNRSLIANWKEKEARTVDTPTAAMPAPPTPPPRKPEPRPQSKPKEEPPLPEDFAAWKLEHFQRAKREKDPRLLDAIAYVEENYSGTKNAEHAARLLLLLLEKRDGRDPQAEQLIPVAPELIRTIVGALVHNGSELAQEALRNLVKGTFKTDDDSVALAAALEGLAEDMYPESEDFLLLAMTNPEKFKPLGKGPVSTQPDSSRPSAYGPAPPKGYTAFGNAAGPMTAEDSLQKRAFQLVAPVASEGIRVKLAKHIADPQTPREDLALFGKYLLSQDPKNLSAQMVLYFAKSMNQRVKDTIEENFIAYSSNALAAILGLSGMEDSSELEGTSEHELRRKLDTSYRMAQQLWAPKLPESLVARLSDASSVQAVGSQSVLATTMPLDSTRTALHKLLTTHWQEGPRALESAWLIDNVIVDPGFLVLVKMLPRKEAESPSEEWTRMSKNLVRACCEGLFAAAGSQPGARHGASEMPLKLHPLAQVVAEYHIDWPTHVGDRLSGVSVDPLKVHYARMQQRGRLSVVKGFYERSLPSPDIHISSDESWLESCLHVSGSNRRRSIDVLIVTHEDLHERSSTEEVNWTVQVLVVEINDPALMRSASD
jgi:serine/threonine protein kinase